MNKPPVPDETQTNRMVLRLLHGLTQKPHLDWIIRTKLRSWASLWNYDPQIGLSELELYHSKDSGASTMRVREDPIPCSKDTIRPPVPPGQSMAPGSGAPPHTPTSAATLNDPCVVHMARCHLPSPNEYLTTTERTRQ
jgi:hypothetical protein